MSKLDKNILLNQVQGQAIINMNVKDQLSILLNRADIEQEPQVGIMTIKKQESQEIIIIIFRKEILFYLWIKDKVLHLHTQEEICHKCHQSN